MQQRAVVDDTAKVNEILVEMRREQDELIDGESLVRFRTMYLNNVLDVSKGVFEGCNESEIKELLRRKSLEEWVIDSKEMRKRLVKMLV